VSTKIEWTDRTWNPVTGCTKVSPGCDNCYAETIAHRFAGSKAFPNGFDVTLHEARISQPLRWKRPARVFVNSMSDLFHADVPGEFIARVFAVMSLGPQHTFQVLTKRPRRLRSLMGNREFLALVDDHREQLRPGCGDFAWPLPNVWLGVSVEDQKRADLRVPALAKTPAAVRFLSCEPLLGPVDVSDWLGTDIDEPGIGWVIAGGESGHGARPMSPDWARSLRDQCAAAEVPYLFKQWGEYQPTDWKVIGRPSDKRNVLVGDPIDDLGHRWEMRRVGKGKAGRELDGRTWDQFPKTAAA
jgi:protein gp37